MKELKRKGVSLILSTWPIRASVNKASAAFKCVGLFCRVGAPKWDLGGSADGICAGWEAINDVCCLEFVKVNIVCVKSEQTGNVAFVFNLIGRLRLMVET